jgi:hypothetical protein
MSLDGNTFSFIPYSLNGIGDAGLGTSYVPYTGALQGTDLGSQAIRTTNVPTLVNDLTNKLYVDTAITASSLLPLNNTFTGTNTFNNSVITNTTLTTNTTTVSNTLTVDTTANASLSNLVRTELNNVLAGYTPATITVGNDFGAITNSLGVYQATSTTTFASLVLGTLTVSEKYSVSLSLKSVDTNTTNLYLYGSTTPNMTGSTGLIVGFSIPPNTTGFTVFTNTITFPVGSTYLLLVYYSQKPGGIDTLFWNAFSVTGMGSVVKNLIAPSTGLDATNKTYVDTAISASSLIPLNNTWTGTNTFNNNLTTGDGYTNTFGNAVYTGVNAITSAVPTTTGITAIAPTPLPAITYSIPTYTCTPSGATSYACFWSSATFTANVRHFFTFTNATTTVSAPTATLQVCQANVANTAYVAISTVYSLPQTTQLFSGYFTPNTNASYVGQIFFILSNVKFTPFTWTAFSHGVGSLTVQGNTTMTGALSVSGRLTYAGLSTCEIYNGNIDAYNATGNNNLMIRSWWGIGFPSYDNVVRIGMDTRTGNADFGGALTTGGNITMASGTFRKNSAGNPNNWAAIQDGGATNSPYMEFYYGSLRRGYIGYADASTNRLSAENNCDFNLYTGGGLRMIVKNSGLTGFGRDPSYTVDINGNQRVFNGLNGNDSMTVYGPNATWGAYLVVGSGTDRSGGATAQVISTNGNLHLDAGNGNSMYYGYYPNSRGAPNTHEFWGTTFNFNSGIPQNTSNYSGVMCMDGNTLRRSQCVINQIYNSNSVAWGGGINITYAFYNYNSTVAVCLQGRYSGYWTSSTTNQIAVRIYNQNSGNYYTFYFNTFTNNTYNHVTVPLNCFIGNTGSGWNDVYVFNNSGYSTDGNDQLLINALTFPVSSY